MVSFPNCKVNLGLHVLARRQDGFHDIETCLYPTPWCDILEIVPSEKFSFIVTGLNIPGNVQGNLCVKAYEILREEFEIAPVSIHLHKIVPMGAGLGAGSSDAAHTLKLINQLFALNLNNSELRKYASKIGSDCAFFIENVPSLGRGKGDELTPLNIDLSGKYMVIVKPSIHVATKDAYADIEPDVKKESVKSIIQGESVSDWKSHLVNDFEETILQKYPLIFEIKKKLYYERASIASMSGSGSAVFGIFDSEIDLENQFRGMTYWSGQL